MARGLSGVVVACALVYTAALLAVPLPQDKVVVLDIGQGDSILIQSGTEQVLVDGGPGMDVLSRLAEEMPWFDRTVDVLLLTHPQLDHQEGLLHILERYRVGLVVLPQLASSAQLQRVWISMLLARHIPYRFAWYGEQVQLADATIHLLAPFAGEVATIAQKNLNDGAVVARVDMHGRSFLLTSDIEAPAEHILLSLVPKELLDVDVLKVGHHGSKTSTTPALLTATSPSAAVISVGAGNPFGHPHQQTLDRLRNANIPVWRTDQRGSVRFLWERGAWLVQTQR